MSEPSVVQGSPVVAFLRFIYIMMYSLSDTVQLDLRSFRQAVGVSTAGTAVQTNVKRFGLGGGTGRGVVGGVGAGTEGRQGYSPC